MRKAALWIFVILAGVSALRWQVRGSYIGGAAGGGGASFGTYAGLPLPSTGALYMQTDGPYTFIGGGSPVSWTAFLPGSASVSYLVPSFSWVNQGGATASTTHGGEILTVPGNGGDSYRTRTVAVPSTPWSIQIAYKLSPWGPNYAGSGIILYDSVGGRGVVCGVGINGGQTLQFQHLTSVTSVSSNPFAVNYWHGQTGDVLFIKMYNDGTNLHCYESTTGGATWNQYYSEAATAWVTTPTSIGYTYDINDSSINGTMWLLHWLQGTS